MDIFTTLYHEVGLFFLPGEYFSYTADKIIRLGGGGGVLGGDSEISFRFVSPREWQVCDWPKLVRRGISIIRPANHTDFISIYRFFTPRIWQLTDFLPSNMAKYIFFSVMQKRFLHIFFRHTDFFS